MFLHLTATSLYRRLNTQLRPAVGAFLSGLFSIIRPEWVSMFNDEEVQMLISGSEEGLDVADMAAHVAYAGEPPVCCVSARCTPYLLLYHPQIQ